MSTLLGYFEMAEQPQNRLEHIPVASIRENSEALRTTVEKDSVSYLELKNAIADAGLLLPIVVREERDENGNVFYPLVDGLQRFTAVSDLGWTTIPAHISTMEENEVLAAQIMANATRVETEPAKYAAGMKRILQLSPTLTSEELGRRVGKSKQWVEGQLKLTKLTAGIQKLVDEGRLTVSNGISLATLPQDKQEEYLQAALSESPATFGPKITEVVKEIRAAARQGRVVSTEFKAQATPRKTSSVKQLLTEIETGNPTTLTGMIQSQGITDPIKAGEYVIKWFFSLDEISVNQQKAKWEQEQREKEDAKRRRQEEAAAKKLADAKKTAETVTT